ncbi:MAG TPA: FtsX-like permease family protein [Caulobacterales bacterium]|nr:FtsX-like permease family protein [Caulobacterales bacterium]
MRALDKKLFRDIWRMRLHAAGVVLVLGCGLAMFVMAVGMRGSLERTRAQYYAEQNMADMAVSVVRAPDGLAEALTRAPGVATVETRIAGYALLDLPQIEEPASARLVSLPTQGRPRVNGLTLAAGRWPDPARLDEALVSQAFADALHLRLGDALNATLNGRRQALRVVGFANSPEFVFVAAPGELFPQPERFGVIWMNREGLARAYDLYGAFNEAVFRLTPGANAVETRRAIDTVLEPYGSTGAYGRERMISDRYLSEELNQLATMAAFLPTFFLVVAAFLVNIAMTRVIATERSNIGLMKALGYTDFAVAWHYAKSALIFAVLGALLGSVGGVAFGHAVAGLYRRYYHFPQLEFSASVATFAGAWLAGLAAASAGAMTSVWNSARLAPAAALAPPRPAAFHQIGGAIAALSDRLDAKSRIILRRIVRFPRRAATTSLGVALAIALLIVSRTFPAVMDHILHAHFSLANRQTVTLTLAQPRGVGVLHDIERLPGVLYAEPFRIEEVVFEHGRHRVQEAVFGTPYNARLSRLIGREGGVVEPPAEGVLLARALAHKLDAKPGDEVRIEETRGERIVTQVRVAGIAEPMVGSSAYMSLDGLSRLVREPDQINGAHLVLDQARYDAFNRQIKETPLLVGASFVRLAERSMRQSIDQSVGRMNVIYGLFAAIMAGGVAFSAARITLAEQERDLATLRVLGFTRSEVSYVLIGELAALALFAAPLGCVLGTGMGMWLMRLFETDMYAFPYVFNPPGYAYAVAFGLACVLVAALIVRRSVDRLDMVAVLKARD